MIIIDLYLNGLGASQIWSLPNRALILIRMNIPIYLYKKIVFKYTFIQKCLNMFKHVFKYVLGSKHDFNAVNVKTSLQNMAGCR